MHPTEPARTPEAARIPCSSPSRAGAVQQGPATAAAKPQVHALRQLITQPQSTSSSVDDNGSWHLVDGDNRSDSGVSVHSESSFSIASLNSDLSSLRGSPKGSPMCRSKPTTLGELEAMPRLQLMA